MKYIIPLTALFLIMIVTTAIAQPEPASSPEKWTDQQVSKWFEKSNWYKQTKLQPDSSIGKREFAVRYFKHKSLWDKAFSFLKNTDLKSLKPGVYELEGKDLFVKVTDYQTRDPEAAAFESHIKYSDIHTVVSGVEYISVASPAVATIKTAYNDEKDIAFYTVTSSRNLLGTPGKFFLLFPDNLHKQGVKVDSNVWVRKIVIKVKN